MSDPISFAELSKAIAAQTVKDNDFLAEFLADPTAAFEKYSGHKSDVKIFAHENTDSEMHFIVPSAVTKDELSDDDLVKVAGGEFFVGVAVVGAIATTAVGGSTIANDQTKARHGW